MHSRQLCATCLCAFSVPAAVLLPRVGWGWTAIGCVSVSLVIFVLSHLRGETRLTAAAVGKSGRMVLWAVWGWNLVMLGASARLLCEIYPNGGAVIGILLLLLATYASSCGEKRVLRVGAVGLFFLAAIFGTVILFALPQTKAAWLRPQSLREGTLLPWLLVPLIGVWLARERTRPIGWCIAGSSLAISAAVITIGSLSPQVVRGMEFPFYAAAKSVVILGAMERLEPFVSAALTVGGFCLLGLLCAVNKTLWQVLCPQKKYWSEALNFVGGGSFLWIAASIGQTVFAVGNTIFWGLTPFVLLLIENRKKIKKIRKNA